MTMPPVRVISFSGDGTGEGELTWSQRLYWLGMQRDGRSAAMGGWTEMPAGTTVDAVAADLARILCRYPSLRTRLILAPSVRQRCFSSGTLDLQVIDGAFGDPLALAEECSFSFLDRSFDYEHEWPVRAAVVVDGAEVRYFVMVYLHTALDAGGLATMLRDLRSEVVSPAPTPLELAARQALPAAQRGSAAALRHQESVLRQLEPERAPVGVRVPQLLWFGSRALALAIPLICDANQADGAAAMFAAFVAGLTRFTGDRQAVVAMMVSNRFRPGLADVVGTLAQDSMLAIDTEGITFAELVIRCRRGLLTAFKSAYYDPVARDALVAQLADGARLQPWCLYNDRRVGAVTPEMTDPVELMKALDSTYWLRQPEASSPDRRVFLHVDERPGEIELALSTDSRWYDEAASIELLRLIEGAAICGAVAPGTLAEDCSLATARAAIQPDPIRL